MKLRPGMREKANGSIEYRVQINGVNKSFTSKTVKGCLEKEMQYIQKIAAGEEIKNGKITLEKYFNEWFDRRAKQVKENTRRKDLSMFENNVPETLKKMKLVDIERRYLLSIQAQFSKEGKISTANEVFKLLHKILRDAVRDEVIDRNPSDDIPYLSREKKEARETIHRALTEKEQKILMDEIKEYCPWYLENFQFLLMTGIRCGELCALSWKDVDLKNGFITVRETETRGLDGKKLKGTPKTSKSSRTVHLNDQAKDVLVRQKKKIIMNSIDNFCFPNQKGTLQDETYYSELLRKICGRITQKGVNFERITTHALRDTFATRFIENGGNMNTLKELLGHSSITITMDLYAHVLEDTKKKEMEAMHFVV